MGNAKKQLAKKMDFPLLGTEKFVKMSPTEKKIYAIVMENPMEKITAQKIANRVKCGKRAIEKFYSKYREDLRSEMRELILLHIHSGGLLQAVQAMIKKASMPSGVQDRITLFKMAGLLDREEEKLDQLPQIINIGVLEASSASEEAPKLAIIPESE